MDYVHIKVGQVALAVACCKEFFANAFICLNEGNSSAGKFACKKHTACTATYDDNVKSFHKHLQKFLFFILQ